MSKHGRVSPSAIMEMSSLYPGFRFCPTDNELISHYLKRKIKGSDISEDVIAEVELCKFEPWELPEKSVIESDHEWFFFSPNDKKYPNGSQAKRATEFGFWKATGKERVIKSGKNVIGSKRTLVFHLGRAPKGTRTDWIMHEYCLKESKDGKPQDSYVICRLRKKQDFSTTKENNSNGESANHIGSSPEPESSTLRASLDVCSDLQQLKMGDHGNGMGGNLEDDCFADILKDDIVNLDDHSLYKAPVLPEAAEDSCLCNPTQSVMPRVDQFQGTAQRRIRLGRQGVRRNLAQEPSVGDEVIRRDANLFIKELKSNIASLFSSRRLTCSCLLVVVVLMVLFWLVV